MRVWEQGFSWRLEAMLKLQQRLLNLCTNWDQFLWPLWSSVSYRVKINNRTNKIVHCWISSLPGSLILIFDLNPMTIDLLFGKNRITCKLKCTTWKFCCINLSSLCVSLRSANWVIVVTITICNKDVHISRIKCIKLQQAN